MEYQNNACLGERYAAPIHYFTAVDRHLAAASAEVSRTGKGQCLTANQWNAMAAALVAAEQLYEIAERIAHGEPTDSERCSAGMDLAYRFVTGKLAELRWRHGLPVVPEAVDWQGHDWATCQCEGCDDVAA